MKHPKHFCVNCNKQTFLTIREHTKYSMYVCRMCGEEICRVGDLPKQSRTDKIQGIIDISSSPEEVQGNISEKWLIGNYPELLSDEHNLWQPRNEEEEWEKHQKLTQFNLNYQTLTERQKEIVEALNKYKTQEKVAIKLGISQSAVAMTLKGIRAKLLQ